MNGSEISNNSKSSSTYYGLGNSKKRKTAHLPQEKIISNPMKISDLSSAKGKNILDLDLKNNFENKSSIEIDYVFNTSNSKKRKFDKIDSYEVVFTSKLPKPSKLFSRHMSKYSDVPTKIPSYSYN